MGRIALISVSDKSNLIDFAKRLIDHEFQIIATGGTHEVLRVNDIPALTISEFTKFPEILNGRVKTLHPKIFAGLLANINNEEHRHSLEELSISAIDLVCVNLYPFEDTVSKTADHAKIIEQIDIGGPSLLRAAAKNAERVTVVCDPKDYDLAIDSFCVQSIRSVLAAKAFRHTSDYDRFIADYFLAELEGEEIQLRYGENPHQKAWLKHLTGDVKILHGKALSYNNIIDASAAIDLVSEFIKPSVAIIKHTNPCGCSVADDIAQAYEKALAGDPLSAFGGIVVANRVIDEKFAIELNRRFFEILIAPSFDEGALSILKRKKNRRILQADISPFCGIQIKTTRLGRLYQDSDPKTELRIEDCKLVSQKFPTSIQKADLMLAWKVVKHVKSNAIVLVKNGAVVGVGAGQMSRIDALDLAIRKAGENAKDSVLASDAFFPFTDGPEHASQAGVVAIIQPGGSKRDQEVIDVCNARQISMVFTGKRHFRH